MNAEHQIQKKIVTEGSDLLFHLRGFILFCWLGAQLGTDAVRVYQFIYIYKIYIININLFIIK